MLEEKRSHGEQKSAYMDNLRKRNRVSESIHEVAYWKRRELIEKKPYEYIPNERKEPAEQERKKRTLNTVKTDSEQSNQSTCNGLTLTCKATKHDQRHRRKRREAKDRPVILETIQEGRDEEECNSETNSETFSEQYAWYKTKCGIADKEEKQMTTGDGKERHDRSDRKRSTPNATTVEAADDSDSDSESEVMKELLSSWTEDEKNSSETHRENRRQRKKEHRRQDCIKV